jgi:hypothetical protein
LDLLGAGLRQSAGTNIMITPGGRRVKSGKGAFAHDREKAVWDVAPGVVYFCHRRPNEPTH